MFYLDKKLSDFSAAHRLTGGYSKKCKNLHGHNYAVTVCVSAQTLNKYDFVMDFDDIKKLFDHWLQNNWDHAVLISEDDVSLHQFCQQEKQKYYLIAGNKNTTAECLSEYLFNVFEQLIEAEYATQAAKPSLHKVTVYETQNSCASYVK